VSLHSCLILRLGAQILPCSSHQAAGTIIWPPLQDRYLYCPIAARNNPFTKESAERRMAVLFMND